MGKKGRDQMTKEKIWDYLLEDGIATEAELSLVTSINGYNEESLNSILYARTGYKDIEQITEDENEDE